MRYKFNYEINTGKGRFWFDTEEEAVKKIDEIMERMYNKYCNKYPNADVIWLNRLLDAGDITEVYVDGHDDFIRITILW